MAPSTAMGDDASARILVSAPSVSPRRWTRVAATILAAVASVTGVLLILIAATLGRCDAFGGTCPADRPSLWEDDVFGMAAFGTVLIVIVPLQLHQPSWRRLRWAITIGAVCAAIVGLLVTTSAHG